MEPLKDQDWANMTNRDIAEVIARMKPRLWFRAWMHLQNVLFKYSKRWRRHHVLHHTTNAPESQPSEPLTLEDIKMMLEKLKVKEE